MIPEKEREALMRLTMCAREECIMCKYHKECDFDYQYETATRCMNILADALRKTDPNCSEKPNNCEYAENSSGDVWECGCFLDTYCEHQIYDRNPDGTINIVECGYEPKDEPQTERSE